MKRVPMVAALSVSAAFLVAATSSVAASVEQFSASCDPFTLTTVMPFAGLGGTGNARLAGDRPSAAVAEPYVERAYRRELGLIQRGEEVPVTRSARRGAPITIPVAFHVIQPDADTGQVSDGKVAEQVAALNDSFDGGTPVGGADTGFRFELVSTDRTIEPDWWPLKYEGAPSKQMKSELREGGPETLNVYTSDLDFHGDDYLGWATFPFSYGSAPRLDGIIVDWRSLPGGSLANFDEGDTVVHEAGHWLGLFHTFEGSPNGCAEPGDLVDDTPAELTDASGCPIGQDTCPASGDDPIHNFMDYTHDSCMYEFTAGQGDRMNAQFARYRVDGRVMLKATARERRRVGAIVVEGSCGGEGCELSAGGRIVAIPEDRGRKLTARLGEESGESESGTSAKLRLAPRRGDRRKIERVLRHGGSARARIRVTAVDDAGNGTSRRLRVQIAP